MMLIALALAASAPSFDCAKASTTVERMICTDPQLAHLDMALALAYRSMSRKDPADHRLWLKTRDECASRDCLLAEYEDRMFFAFPYDAPRVRSYRSRDNDGTLTILPLGDGWYVFHVVGLWDTAPQRTLLSLSDHSGLTPKARPHGLPLTTRIADGVFKDFPRIAGS